MSDLNELIEKLSPEDQEALKTAIQRRLSSNPGPAEDPEDPPEEIPERYELGPIIVSPEEWVEDWLTGVEAKARKWKRKALRPSAPPITRGKSAAAEAKFKDKMSKVLEQQRRRKGLEKWTDEEWGERIAETMPEDYTRGARRKRYKMHKKIELQHELRGYAKQKLRAMPVATAEQRERKLIAAKRTNEIIGLFIKGVIDATEARRRIDTETTVR